MPNHITIEVESTEEVINSLLNKEDEVDFDLVTPMPEEVKDDGWYNWSIENWGTKWNAYDTYRISEVCVTFQTAWSAPIPVLLELSDQNPGEAITVRWADEDTGHNVGEVEFLDGECIMEDVHEGGSKEAYEKCFLIRGGEEYYRFDEDEGTYVYDEGEDE